MWISSFARAFPAAFKCGSGLVGVGAFLSPCRINMGSLTQVRENKRVRVHNVSKMSPTEVQSRKIAMACTTTPDRRQRNAVKNEYAHEYSLSEFGLSFA